jgi:hypothetical protein
MQGFDFEIIYKNGKDNVVVDEIYRIEETSRLYSITYSILVWMEEAFHEWKNDNNTKQKNTMSKGRDELYGTLRVEGRYTLLQG